MSTYDDDPKYSYTQKDYVPTIGNQVPSAPFQFDLDLGYHDEDYLRDRLSKIVEISEAIIKSSEEDLENYSLKVVEGSSLEKAHVQEWPSSIGTPANYVSYQEYKGLEKSKTRSSVYVRKTYEDSIRGPFGTNSADTMLISEAIKNEATNMTKFIDTYLGDVSDTSEYRTLELLQDWAEDGLQQITNVAAIFTQRVENEVQIPSAEMDQITEADARNYQAFFQTKINAVNKEIKQLVDDLNKEHNIMGEIFYEKFLGPSLKFRLNVARPLESNIGIDTFLSQQAGQADQAMAANYINLLTDQIKRNENFNGRMENLLTRVRIRDNYSGFVKQLNTKLESEVASPFVDVDIPEEEVEGFKDLATTLETAAEEVNVFQSGHSMLDGVDEDDAHTQYLLKSGGTIVGDVELEGATIDGIVPSTHAHTGADGSVRIKGSDIEGGTLNTGAVNTGEIPPKPTNLTLEVLSLTTVPPGVNVVDALISWQGENGFTYEVQISKPQTGV